MCFPFLRYLEVILPYNTNYFKMFLDMKMAKYYRYFKLWEFFRRNSQTHKISIIFNYRQTPKEGNLLNYCTDVKNWKKKTQISNKSQRQRSNDFKVELVRVASSTEKPINYNFVLIIKKLNSSYIPTYYSLFIFVCSYLYIFHVR